MLKTAKLVKDWLKMIDKCLSRHKREENKEIMGRSTRTDSEYYFLYMTRGEITFPKFSY
jgi:hypothetical protein